MTKAAAAASGPRSAATDAGTRGVPSVTLKPAAQKTASSAGPHASSASCSRTIPVSAAAAPSAIDRRATDHVVARAARGRPAARPRTRSRRAPWAARRTYKRGAACRTRSRPSPQSRRGRGAGPPRWTTATRGSRRAPSHSRPPRCRASSSRRRRRRGRRMQHTRGQIPDGVERRPQDRAADRAEVDPPAGVGLALEKGLVKAPDSARCRDRRNTGTRSRTRGRGRTRAIAGRRSTCISSDA